MEDSIFALLCLFGFWASVIYLICRAVKQAPIKMYLKKIKRTEEQTEVVKYFLNDGGCLAGRMSDEEYDAITEKFLSQDFRSKALDRIGLDEEELKEVPPLFLHDYNYNQSTLACQGDDEKWRSSSYQVSWLFFSSNQLYLYQENANFDHSERRVTTEELYYKDVTAFSATTETEMFIESFDRLGREKYGYRETTKLCIVVPGTKFYAAMTPTPENERAIQGLRSKLREKKNS